MKTSRVNTIKNYLHPSSAYWERIPTAQIPMIATPLQMQPTEYIRNSWENKLYGSIPTLKIASVHDGQTWAVRATWQGSGPGKTDFPDALAVALPVRNKPVLALMGDVDAPIHYLRWSADKPGVLSLIANGIGRSAPGPSFKQVAQAVATGKTWNLVIARPMGTGNNIAPLLPGKKTGLGFAVWQGANEERAGIKAFSIDWTELELEA